jgi:hypothetical protein
MAKRKERKYFMLRRIREKSKGSTKQGSVKSKPPAGPKPIKIRGEQEDMKGGR